MLPFGHSSLELAHAVPGTQSLMCIFLPCRTTHPRLHETVTGLMLHTCSEQRCLKDGRCTKHFPKPFQEQTILAEDSYPVYRRREVPDTPENATRRSMPVHGQPSKGNEWVVPYNKFLSTKYNCHTNVELTCGIKVVKYLYKYIYKGPDQAQLAIQIRNQHANVRPAGEGVQPPQLDEILAFQNGQYWSSSEASWAYCWWQHARWGPHC